MADGRLAILWHMHQPDYRHPHSGAPVMPWVRLHTLRGYRDVVADTVRDGVPVTINVVPSLLDQMLAYARGQTDRHLELTRRSADALAPSEAEEVLDTFIAGHPAMRQAHAGFRDLEARVASGEPLDKHGVRDLQVWSTLAWFGASALRDFPELQELRAKGRGFTEGDKSAMLAAQDAILKQFPGLFAELPAAGAALSTSPYYHPILPLLVDTAHARRSLPDAPPESLFAWPGDALEQLVRARARVKALLGVEPPGLWPSEGAVSPETVDLAVQAGFEWMASDQEVLERSERHGHGINGGWALQPGMVGFFRDRDLSDRVGFHYARQDAAEAVEDFVNTAAERAGDRVLLVALDGENPWEAWPGAGGAFRDRLHQALSDGPIRGITLDEAARREPVGRVHRLHTGSWIGANLGIWYGHEQDRTAWRVLGEAHRAIDEAPPDKAAKALDRLLPAEGSDWTWWYGEEFSTDYDGLFDELFRSHVRAAWEELERPPPPALFKHIREGAGPTVTPPRRQVRPKLVEMPAWIHWSGAGRVRWPPSGSMGRGAVHTTGMLYGWSPADEAWPRGCLWLRIDLPPVLPAEGDAQWELVIDGTQASLPYARPGARAQGDGFEVLAGPRNVIAQVDARLLHGDRVDLVVCVAGRSRTRYPATGAVHLPRPGGLDWWRV